jgi:hypothetical protein
MMLAGNRKVRSSCRNTGGWVTLSKAARASAK